MIIDSFNKFIVPLQGNYSEMLPTPSQAKGKVSNGHKISVHDLGNRHSSRGKPFQTLGPTTENAQLCRATDYKHLTCAATLVLVTYFTFKPNVLLVLITINFH